MDYPALEVNRAFLNQRGCIELSVIDLKNLRFVDSVTRIDTAKVNLFDQICRRNINGKGVVC